MKFTVNSTDFKKAIDRVATIANVKSSVPIVHQIRIATENHCVTVSSANLEQSAKVELSADIGESGCVYVHVEDIVKAYNMSGDITIVADDGKLRIRNNKKTAEILIMDSTDADLPPLPHFDFNTEPVYVFGAGSLLTVLKELEPFVSKENARPILQGYNINGKEGWIAACDAYKVGMWKCAESRDEALDVTVPAKAYTVLKNIVDSKAKGNIEIYVDEKKQNICFKGDDYTYSSRLFEGKYINIKSLMKASTDSSFSVDSDELKRVSKETAKLTKKEGCQKMYLVKNGHSLYSGILLPDYQSTEALETVNGLCSVPDNFAMALNPKFITDIANLYSEKIRVRFDSRTTTKDGKYYMILLIDSADPDNSNYHCFVLPQIYETTEITRLHNLINAN